MPDGNCYRYRQLPERRLAGIPNHWTYRAKLERKWRRRGYAVRFV